MKFRFDSRYLFIAILTLVLGGMIATTLRHIPFIRGSTSDIVATMFVFFSILAFWRIQLPKLAVFSFGFACVIEFGQYFHLADRLGLQRGSSLSILLGNTFSLADIAYYALGVGISVLIVSLFIKEKSS